MLMKKLKITLAALTTTLSLTAASEVYAQTRLPRIKSSVYKPGVKDPNYNPSRSPFNPDGTRNIVRERRNTVLHGTPYDRNNRRESLHYRTLHKRSAQPSRVKR